MGNPWDIKKAPLVVGASVGLVNAISPDYSEKNLNALALALAQANNSCQLGRFHTLCLCIRTRVNWGFGGEHHQLLQLEQADDAAHFVKPSLWLNFSAGSEDAEPVFYLANPRCNR